MKALYNDNDPKACAWLRELIRAGLIAEGTVDERSILEITPADLEGVRRYHAFAGIGGWDIALRLAGWPDDREVWTASCPCQPFSDAGARRGVRDERWGLDGVGRARYGVASGPLGKNARDTLNPNTTPRPLPTGVRYRGPDFGRGVALVWGYGWPLTGSK